MSYEATLLIVNEREQVIAHREGSSIMLPKVNVEPGRLGISLTRAVREQMRLEIFHLVPTQFSNCPWHLLRLQREGQTLPRGCGWYNASELSEERPIEAYVRAYSSSEDQEVGRFGWYSQVELWLAGHVGGLGFAIRSLEQWNGEVGGVLLRVITNGPQFWFKAVGGFNVREIWIAKMLVERHPGRFPQVLATEPRWNAFLLQHVKGVELFECKDFSFWKQTAEVLAEIQIDWVGEVNTLLLAGAADLRPETLIARIPEFVNVMADKMICKTMPPQATLTRVELEILGDFLYSLSADAATLPFSCGLANADFSPHNTLITDHGPVFIDWAEACVSFPLVAGEYFWNRMAVELPTRALWQDPLREAYFARWALVFENEAMELAQKILPAFAIYAAIVFYLEGKGQGYDDYVRSLTRRLYKMIKVDTPSRYSISM